MSIIHEPIESGESRRTFRLRTADELIQQAIVGHGIEEVSLLYKYPPPGVIQTSSKVSFFLPDFLVAKKFFVFFKQRFYL